MRQPAATLEAFYQSRLGRCAAERISARLMDLWGSCEGQRVLGIGYPSPLLPLWQDHAASCIGAVPEEIGEVRLVSERGQSLCLAPEQRLPFSEGLFDRVFMLHALARLQNSGQAGAMCAVRVGQIACCIDLMGFELLEQVDDHLDVVIRQCLLLDAALDHEARRHL